MSTLRLPRLRTAPAARPKIAPATLVVRPDVVRAIAAAAGAAGAHETGGPLFGTVQRSWSGSRFSLLVSVLGTVPPGPAVQGRLASVCLGAGSDGERAEAALRWLRGATGLDLLHLGDWHVHPGGTCEPSLGDVKTAEAMHAKSAAPVWLAAIAVSRHDRREELAPQEHAVRCTRKHVESAKLCFYQTLGRALVPLSIRIEEAAIPRLPPLPWHIADPARFAAECRLLDAAGYRVAVEANGVPGLSLRVTSEGAGPLIVATGVRFPEAAPELFDERRRRVALRHPWSPDRFLVDVVREVSR